MSRLRQSFVTVPVNRSYSVWNMYGPTETSFWCMLDRVRPESAITLDVQSRHLVDRI